MNDPKHAHLEAPVGAEDDKYKLEQAGRCTGELASNPSTKALAAGEGSLPLKVAS
jgi:hypothetical protein